MHACRLGPISALDTARALRRAGLLVLVVLRCALDRRYPALAPLHPDLVIRLQLEGRIIQTSDPNLDERVAGVGCVKELRPTAGAEAATVIARDLAAHLKRLDGPLRIHTERTARLLSAIRAVAAPDMHRLTANAVADRPAETSAGAYSCLHARRCYAHYGGPLFGISPERARYQPPQLGVWSPMITGRSRYDSELEARRSST